MLRGRNVDNTVFTIGHSTHPFDEFVQILNAFNIDMIADVRSIPASRHNPQYNQAGLEVELPRLGIRYVHMKELGGLRHAARSSPNTAWKNASFRGFADHMQTVGFSAGIDQLVEWIPHNRIALMCAEVLPWRCHRSLIGDALLLKGLIVKDILNGKTIRSHLMTPWAVVNGSTITYPGTSPEVVE
jgi:uncharacterized protein (DUF488 family)